MEYQFSFNARMLVLLSLALLLALGTSFALGMLAAEMRAKPATAAAAVSAPPANSAKIAR